MKNLETLSLLKDLHGLLYPPWRNNAVYLTPIGVHEAAIREIKRKDEITERLDEAIKQLEND